MSETMLEVIALARSNAQHQSCD